MAIATPHHKLYPVATGTRYALALEKQARGIVALHQSGQTITLRRRDLWEVAEALANWSPRNGAA